jgi:hypothetical protein
MEQFINAQKAIAGRKHNNSSITQIAAIAGHMHRKLTASPQTQAV